MRSIRAGLLAVATLLAAPLALAALWFGPSWRVGLKERLTPPARRADHPLWIHVASVGEAAAAGPLIEALAKIHGSVFLTAQTTSGRARLERDHPRLATRLVPLDHPWLVRRAMARVDPRALVLVETELWPALIAAAAGRGVPVAVVSGRLSERSFRLRRELTPLLASPLLRLARVGARSDADADRFRALGVPAARVRTTGDLKWAKAPPNAPAAPELARWLALRPTIVLGSTHRDEEAELSKAIAVVRASGRDVGWLVAPRHPDEVPGLMRRLEGDGFAVQRRSQLPRAKPTDAGTEGPAAPAGVDESRVLVLDTVGELAAAWPHAVLAFVGGTFGATGGHDLLEPVHAGRPVLFGPSIHGVEDVAAALLDARVGVQVASGEALGREILRLLDAPRECADRAARGTALLEAGRASLDANVDLVADVVAGRLPERVSPESLDLRSTQAPRGLYARRGPQGSGAASLVRSAAAPLYGFLTRIDRRSGRLGLRRRRRLPCSVVSVGSLLAGGAAKTPVTVALARGLRARGHRVAVVTRGHGVRLRGRVEIASHGAGDAAAADRVGDEAAEIARAVPDVPVLAARDRAHAGLVAITEFGCDLLLLDDAFSHHGLHRDVDLVCLDAGIGLGNARVLPAGPLREPPSAWSRADALIVTGGELRADDARRIEAHAPSLRRFDGARRCRGWRRLRTGELSPPGHLCGQRVGLLAGLADPASFRALAEADGVRVVRARLAADHAPWQADEIARLGREAPVWITTAKDAVKIERAWLSPGVELWVLELEWVADDWEALLDFVEEACLRAQRGRATGSPRGSIGDVASRATPSAASPASPSRPPASTPDRPPTPRASLPS